jgi:hypothetical protein
MATAKTMRAEEDVEALLAQVESSEPAHVAVPGALLQAGGEEAPEEPAPASPASGMDGAPTDGSRVWLVSDDAPEQYEAYWRPSRRFDGGKWAEFSYWAIWGTPMRVPFEPSGWYPAGTE